MKVDFLREPELEFGAGRHVDIRFGLMHYGPLDFESHLAPKQIRLGIVGTPETIEGLEQWFERCRDGLPAKPSKQPNLFPRFPGFSPEVSFRSSLVTDMQLQRPISRQAIDRLTKIPRVNTLVSEAVDVFFGEFQYLVENSNVDVLICALPMELLEAMDPNTTDQGDTESEEIPTKRDFHHHLKARAMPLKKPVQIVLPMTYDEKMRRRQKGRPQRTREPQDPATCAWNLHTALYYKAGGVPWRLIRDPAQLTACYVGVSFFKTLDASRLMTSVAQVFNQRGEGVIVRGGAAQISREDRQPHLSAADSQKLLSDALRKYREVHKTVPARIVLHKSSRYSRSELDGFNQAASEERIEFCELISLGDSYCRLLRIGPYPPLRGTLLSLDDVGQVLYTRGGVDFFETYPGMYVPLPLLFRCEQVSHTPRFLAQEILALSKMNWNNTQFDGGEPITIRAARQVGNILKYADEGDFVEPRYASYM